MNYIMFLKKKFNVSWFISFIMNSFQSILASIFFGFSLKIFFDNINTEKMYLGIYILAIGTLYMIFVVPIVGYFMEKGNFKYKYGITVLFINNILDLNFIDFFKKDKSDYITNLQYDINNANYLTGWNLVVLFQAIISGTLSSAVIMRYSFKLYFISITGGILLIVINNLIVKKTKSHVIELREKSKNKTKKIVDYADNVMYYKIYDKEKELLSNLKNDLREYAYTDYNYEMIYTKLEFLEQIISEILLYITVLICGFILIKKGEITFGSLMLILEFLTGIIFIFSYIGKYTASIQKSINSLKEIDKYLKDNTLLAINSYQNKEANIEIRNIRFDNLSFKYSNEDKIFEGLNLLFGYKEKIKIVGANGIGKTTLFKILLGLYDDYTGNIYINNKDIKNIQMEFLKEKIAFVPQESFLLKDTIKNNIALGRKISEKKLYELFDLVELNYKNPNDKILFKGENLSLGERKKIILARALFNIPDVYIQDELDANLNENSYTSIENKLLKYLEDKIFIKISHQKYNNDEKFKTLSIGY